MNSKCRYCPGFMTGTCKKRSYNSEECKNGRDKYDKEMRRCLKTHCLHCGKRKDIPDGWDVVKEIRDEAINNYYDVETSNHAYDAGVLNEAKHIANFAYYKLRDVGIEIEEE